MITNMKKLGIFLAVALAALVFVSCEQSKTISPAQADEILTITATRAGSPTRSLLAWETYTYEYDDYSYTYDWLAIYWSAPDKILVGYPGTDVATFKSTNTTPAATATFKGKLPVSGGEDVLVGVYPADDGVAINMSPATITLPFHDQQKAVAGSYDPLAFPAIAVSDTKNLSFYNVCGLLEFRPFDEGVDEIVLERTAPMPGGTLEIDPFGYVLRSEPTGDEFYEEPYDEDEYEGGSYYLSPAIIDGDEITAISLKAPSGQTLQPGESYYMSVPPLNFVYDQADIVLKKNGEEFKRFRRSGYLSRSSVHKVPICDAYDFSGFTGAWYWYDEEDDGYNFAFFENMPSGNPGTLTRDPGGRWLVINIPGQYINSTQHPGSKDLNTHDWSFFIDFVATRSWQFRTGDVTINLDKEAGTVEMSVVCETAYDISIKASYSGPVEKADSYIWDSYYEYY